MATIDPIAFAIELMSCPSVTPEDHGAQAVVGQALAGMGFTLAPLPFEGEGEARVDNLYARLGQGGPFFAFAGHTDVVPPGDVTTWSVPPFVPEIREGWLIGRGAEDMKGAIACMVAAISRFVEEKPDFKGSIGLIITGDEEGNAFVNGTKKMVPWLKEHGEIPDMCIVGEPTNPEHIGDMVKIGRRGSMNMVLTVKGKQGHVAYPHLADNPCTPLIRIMHELKSAVIDEGMEFFQASNLEITSMDVGNPAKNVIPGRAEARINIRFNPLHNSAKMADWIRGVAAKHAEKFDLEVRVSGEAFLTQPGKYTDLVSAAIEDVIGTKPQLSTTGGTSDARFIKDLCPVMEFGTTGKTAHMVDEKVRVEDLRLLTECYLSILQRFFAHTL